MGEDEETSKPQDAGHMGQEVGSRGESQTLPELTSNGVIGHQVDTQSHVHDIEQTALSHVDEDFKASTGIYVAFITLMVITLMVALDGKSLSVALPVSVLLCSPDGIARQLGRPI